ncbi:MAG: transglutaminase family protein, partial [Magnetococcus sp. WYHC-3]
FLEFRFPKYGETHVGDLHLELRQALEPWHVLGEEMGSGGTTRYVDSSVERLQIRLTGLTPERYLVACNGHALPLRNTGTFGEYVAGVRFKAWQPASGLHPLIAVHGPLVFDIIDTWNNKALGGCTYHVAHPGGRSYETLPVNAYEAESRRIARYYDQGHTPGQVPVEKWTPPRSTGRFVPHRGASGHAHGVIRQPRNSEYPTTLDLRRD